MPTQGANYAVDAAYSAGTQVTSIYLMLIDGDGFTGISESDTPDSHAGWTEFTDYTGDRPLFSDLGAAGGLVANPPGATFPITANGTVKGIALVSVATKSTTTGTFVAPPKLFDEGDQAVVSGDNFRAVAEIQAVFSNVTG